MRTLTLALSAWLLIAGCAATAKPVVMEVTQPTPEESAPWYRWLSCHCGTTCPNEKRPTWVVVLDALDIVASGYTTYKDGSSPAPCPRH